MNLWCMITDGSASRDREAWLQYVMSAIDAGGVHMIQIREKDLEARELLDLARIVVAYAGKDVLVLVNTRVDVAVAAGAAGVHLPSDAPPASRLKSMAPGLVMGVSCHTLTELRAADRDGADYALFGPVFAPLSKSSALAPRGIDGLRSAVRSVSIPVFAVGGMTRGNAAACFEAGARGVAAISLFRPTSPE